MAVYVASSGALVWDKPLKYNNPPILYHDQIITDNAAYELATGQRRLSVDPLTAEEMPWSYARGYGVQLQHRQRAPSVLPFRGRRVL